MGEEEVVKSVGRTGLGLGLVVVRPGGRPRKLNRKSNASSRGNSGIYWMERTHFICRPRLVSDALGSRLPFSIVVGRSKMKLSKLQGEAERLNEVHLITLYEKEQPIPFRGQWPFLLLFIPRQVFSEKELSEVALLLNCRDAICSSSGQLARRRWIWQ